MQPNYKLSQVNCGLIWKEISEKKKSSGKKERGRERGRKEERHFTKIAPKLLQIVQEFRKYYNFPLMWEKIETGKKWTKKPERWMLKKDFRTTKRDSSFPCILEWWVFPRGKYVQWTNSTLTKHHVSVKAIITRLTYFTKTNLKKWCSFLNSVPFKRGTKRG